MTLQSVMMALPTSYYCVQREKLGQSERGILEYSIGLVMLRREVSPSTNCPFMLFQFKKRLIEADVPPNAAKWIRI